MIARSSSGGSASSRTVSDLVEIVVQAAAEEILPRYRRLDPAAIRSKSGPLDLVTEADEAAERAITTALRARYPGIVVVGEEACASDPSIADALESAELAALVDPIDGTANFAAGVPMFGAMIALIRRGEPVAAVIHDPLGRDCIVAEIGGGAFHLDAAGEAMRLSVAPPVEVQRMSGKASARQFAAPRDADLAVRLLGVLSSWDFRCAAHEYRMVTSGACHFSIYNTLMPWDHAPGQLIHAEAGGFARKLDGSRYRVADRSGGLICAPDAASWRALHDFLFA